MLYYVLRRLLLLPLTLFCIVLVNFIIINMAPGDPVTVTEISPEGMQREDRSIAFGSDDRYLQFRERYGLTLPILLNTWPYTSQQQVNATLEKLLEKDKMNVKDYNALRLRFGDMAQFIMPKLLDTLEDNSKNFDIRALAANFFIRGGTRQAVLGPNLPESDKAYNNKVAKDNQLLETLLPAPKDTHEMIQKKFQQLKKWYGENQALYGFEPSPSQKILILFTQNRFFKYMSRVLTLDFGTMRNDENKTVISEVAKRFKYSLTLALLPMLLTFFLCQLFGFFMAYKHNRFPDHALNLFFLILYAVPVFVAAPFLIEKIAFNGKFPFTDIPIPLSGFTNPESLYEKETSWQRLADVLQHIFLPLVAILYGSLASETRLSRTAVLETLKQDYVRTAKAKGLAPFAILFKHVGRNAGITIVTSLAGSLGIVLGGSLIVETLFQINGFGKFFYDAILNRDYNVIMFSALAGSFLSLLGYLAADIAYTLLDPRLTLD